MSKSERMAMNVALAHAAGHPVQIVSMEDEYADRLAREQRYAEQMALYTFGARGVMNSWSSRPLAGRPGSGRGWITWNPKDPGPFPVVDTTHPENRYGTLAVDRCLAEQAAEKAGSPA
jgi:hypothetical protein